MRLQSTPGEFILKKSVYLVGLYILFFKGLSFAPFAIIGNDGFLILTFLYLLFGKYIYRQSTPIELSCAYSKCICWIFIGIFLSMISAKAYYHQSIFQSLIAYRTQYLMVTPLFLAKMNFSQKDFIKSLYLYSWIYIMFYIIRAVIPGLFIFSENYDPSEGAVLIGYILLTVPLYYSLQKLTLHFTFRNSLYILLLIAIIFLQENRSTLFPVLILSGLFLLKIKSRFKIPLLIFSALIISIIILQVWDTIQDLIDQTQFELNNPNYNRNKAFSYFIEEFSPNLWCTIFGNGFLSFHSTPIMQLLMYQGIYNSDLGFVGYWNQFGIIPIFVFIGLYLTAIFTKRIPLYLKAISIQTLVCGLTISYFGSPNHMIFFFIFYYLFFINYSHHKRIKPD